MPAGVHRLMQHTDNVDSVVFDAVEDDVGTAASLK
jgi:hypothetical protein